MSRTNPVRKISVLIVDDHPLVRFGIRTMLEKENPNYLFEVGECEGADQAISAVRKKDFDIVLMDYQMPEICGPEAIRLLHGIRRDLKVLAISNYDEVAYVKDMIDNGARGYILKDIGLNELVLAIDTILHGELFYSNNVAMKLISQVENSREQRDLEKIPITRREMEVLRYIASEESNGQIAAKMNIAKRTVDAHRQNLIRKTGVKNTAGLVKLALKLNLI